MAKNVTRKQPNEIGRLKRMGLERKLVKASEGKMRLSDVMQESIQDTLAAGIDRSDAVRVSKKEIRRQANRKARGLPA